MNTQKLIELGGKEWIKGDMHRIYINMDLFYANSELQVTFYKTGNISSAKFQGEVISNSKAYKLIPAKLYFDVKTGKFNAYVDEMCALEVFASNIRELCA